MVILVGLLWFSWKCFVIEKDELKAMLSPSEIINAAMKAMLSPPTSVKWLRGKRCHRHQLIVRVLGKPFCRMIRGESDVIASNQYQTTGNPIYKIISGKRCYRRLTNLMSIAATICEKWWSWWVSCDFHENALLYRKMSWKRCYRPLRLKMLQWKRCYRLQQV